MSKIETTGRRVEFRAVGRDDDPDGGQSDYDRGPWTSQRGALADYDDYRQYDGLPTAYDAVWIERRTIRETIEGPSRLRPSSIEKLRLLSTGSNP